MSRRTTLTYHEAKALRAASEEIFGGEQAVQRCCNHKLRNVLDELPKEQQGQTRNLMRAAWKVKNDWRFLGPRVVSMGQCKARSAQRVKVLNWAALGPAHQK